ncbi:MAG: replication-associated recombination protein A, partial [Flavobacteriales bacterium]|nr:replication-associated recombination protein A [Flavobacteriales bacterium]
LPIPLSLRNAPTDLMKDLGYGSGYAYDHDAQGGFSGQELMPEALIGRVLYQPGDNAREQQIQAQLRSMWKEKYGY